MKSSPKIVQKYETADYFGYEFDYQADFTQVLEEARKNTGPGNIKTKPLPKESNQHLDGEKKSKKSWKSSLFSWLKTDKKNKAPAHQADGITTSKQKGSYFSGPVHGSGGRITGKALKPVSGPLIGLFDSSRRVEDKVPYMCLDQLNNPRDVQSFGPVYLVT